MMDAKRLFDKVREIKGSPLTQAEVNEINAILAPVAAKPAEVALPPHPKIPMDVILGARESERTYKLPASVTLAQWALESGWGKSVSGKWNYGGITAKVKGAVFPFKPGEPLEPATLCWTHEQYQGKRVECQRWFKDFASADEFFAQHAKLVGTAAVYAPARAKLPDVDAFVDALGPIYATDPGYAKTIKSIMKTNGLYAYNLGAAA